MRVKKTVKINAGSNVSVSELIIDDKERVDELNENLEALGKSVNEQMSNRYKYLTESCKKISVLVGNLNDSIRQTGQEDEKNSVI